MELTTKQYNQVSTTIKKHLFKRGIFLSKWDFEDNLQQTFLQILLKYSDKTFEEILAISCTIFYSICVDCHKGLGCVNSTKIKGDEYYHKEEQRPFEELLNSEIKLDIGEITFYDLVEKIRWGGKIISPYTNSDSISYYPNGTYRDMVNKKYFTIKTNTIFEKVPLNWNNILLVIYGYINHWSIDKIWKLRDKNACPYDNKRECFNSFWNLLKSEITLSKDLDIRKTLEILFNINVKNYDYMESQKIFNKKYSKKELLKILQSPNDFETELQNVFRFLRWGDFITSPYDINSIIYQRNIEGKDVFRCRNTQNNFTITTKTIFQNSKLSLLNIFQIIREVFYNKDVKIKSIIEIVGRNMQTCWKVLYKIRYVIKDNKIEENSDIISFFKKILSYEFEDNILIPSVKIETKKIKNKENMKEDNLSNIEKINIRSREEFEKSISNLRIEEIRRGLIYFLNNNIEISIEFIKEYNELLKKL